MEDMERTTPAGITTLVERLLENAAPISLMLDHMISAPDTDDPADVVGTLKELMREALRGLSERHPRHDLEVTAAILADVTATLTGEILLVPHPEDPAWEDRPLC